MAPTRLRKRKSEHTPTASLERSPIKKRKMGITITQKQALIDNLQLEVTERARRLRAQYNIQAQQLRSRVEMRVNRIPRTLRRVPMGELLAKSLEPQQQAQASKAPYVAKPPPVPAKDNSSSPVFTRKPVPPSNYRHEIQHLSHEMTADKENQADHVDSPKRRPRGAPAKDSAPVAAQILSPTSSNARIVPRERPASPTKSLIGRPASPVKRPTTKASSNILSSMVEKARATRPATAAGKTTASSSASSSSGPPVVAAAAGAATAGRTRRAAAAAPPSAAATRGRRKQSAASESSEASTATVVKKTTASRAAKTAPTTKRTVMGTIKSATTKKAPAPKPAAAPAATTGRTLRKRR